MVAFACVASNTSALAAEAMLIEPLKAVGKIRVGMTREDVVRELGPAASGKDGIYSKLGIGIIYGGHNGPQDVVQRVMCGHALSKSPQVKAFKGQTKEGIGMGSSRADVIKAFGQPSQTRKPDTGYEVLVYVDKGLTFGLTDGKVHIITVSFVPGK